VDLRLDQRVHGRVLQAAQAEGLSVSGWVRRAILDRLGDATREASERAALLAEARRFLADPGEGRDAAGLVSRYVRALETVSGRMSAAEAHGRQRALLEIARGALEPLDGEELTYGEFRPGPPPALELAGTPRRRGFLREQLARERARALLAAPPVIPPAPSAAGLLGEQRTRELWSEAISWPGWRRIFCSVHGVVPCAPSSDGARCYLGCSIPARPEAA